MFPPVIRMIRMTRQRQEFLARGENLSVTSDRAIVLVDRAQRQVEYEQDIRVVPYRRIILII